MERSAWRSRVRRASLAAAVMYNVILLGLTSFFTDVASEMVYPLVPFFLTLRLGASPAVLGVIEGLAESAASVLKVISGRLSDRLHNRKGLTIAGYTCSALGKLLLALASGWGMVLSGRVVDRIGKGIRTAPRDALVADSTDGGRHGRAFGLHRALDSCGAVIGVSLAYFFFTRHTGDYGRVFLWSVVPAVAAVGLLFFVREPKAHPTSARESPSFRWGALPWRLRWFLIVTFVFTLGNSSNTFLLPDVQRGLRIGVVPGRLAVGSRRAQDAAGRRLCVLQRRVLRFRRAASVTAYAALGIVRLLRFVHRGDRWRREGVGDRSHPGGAARDRDWTARDDRRHRFVPGVVRCRRALGARQCRGDILLRRCDGRCRRGRSPVAVRFAISWKGVSIFVGE